MISASHNPYVDNGLKIFGADGYKIDADQEAEIEALVTALQQDQRTDLLADPQDLGV